MPAKRSQGSATKKRKGSAKHKGMAQGNMRAWRHDGIVASRFTAANSDAESYAQRLMFDYKVSVEMHGRFVEQSALDSISLHDMVVGDIPALKVYILAITNKHETSKLQTLGARPL